MINILLCGNRKVFDGALCELISITKRTKEPITCFIFTADVSRINEAYVPISDEQVTFLDAYVKEKNTENMKRKNFLCWKNIYEKFYNKPLEYTTEDKELSPLKDME